MRLTLLCVTIFGFTQLANAELIEKDLVPNSGDHSLTFDRRTGFEWLDVTLTQGRSFAEVKNGWGGWLDQGFRIANQTEVDGLIESSGLTPNKMYNTESDTGAAADIQAVKDLTQKLGRTFIYEDEGSPYQRRSTYGYVADDYNPSPVYANFGRYADIGFYERNYGTMAWALDGSDAQIYRDGQYGGVGTFLIRTAQVAAVPEPSAFALFLVGLSALGLARKVRKY